MLKVLNDLVAIRRKDKEEMSSGGILLPESQREATCLGEVIAVGQGRVLANGSVLPLSVEVGDTVVFSPLWNNEVEIKREKVLIISEGDVLMVLENK